VRCSAELAISSPTRRSAVELESQLSWALSAMHDGFQVSEVATGRTRRYVAFQVAANADLHSSKDRNHSV
jgi:hypothetical protein